MHNFININSISLILLIFVIVLLKLRSERKAFAKKHEKSYTKEENPYIYAHEDMKNKRNINLYCEQNPDKERTGFLSPKVYPTSGDLDEYLEYMRKEEENEYSLPE